MLNCKHDGFLVILLVAIFFPLVLGIGNNSPLLFTAPPPFPVTTTINTKTDNTYDVLNAIKLLQSMGVPIENLCTINKEVSLFQKMVSSSSSSSQLLLPLCDDDRYQSSHQYRNLQEEPELEEEVNCVPKEEEEPTFQDDPWFYITHAICALICVTAAALAAGLTLGLLSLDPLMLLIKMRAGATAKEREQAEQLLPIVEQHHLLLVTLLLLNSMANEALPLFLEVLVSPVVAVILSVTLVLFFGEIIPSAVFTGPNRIALACKMRPIVQLVMCVLWPIAYPIAKILDNVLHEDEDDSQLTRGELSALVRIQYEERMTAKQERKKQREAYRSYVQSERRRLSSKTNIIPSETAATGVPFKSSRLDAAVRAGKQEIKLRRSILSTADSNSSALSGGIPYSGRANSIGSSARGSAPSSAFAATRQITPIHVDEVTMVEGVLQMGTKVAMDVFTPIHRMFSISYDTILNEGNVVSIYSSGYSRIPVFQPNPEKPKQRWAIVGIMVTKQLIVVSPNENRPVSTLPLYKPLCISPKTCLVDLLNHFQTGKVGHMALVCARPKLAQEALDEGRPLPQESGLMGVITLEDVLESLIQEEIYDETDRIEREEVRIARWVTNKWKRFVANKKRERNQMQNDPEMHVTMGSVVVHEIMKGTYPHDQESGDSTDASPGEGTSLLRGDERNNTSSSSSENQNPTAFGLFGFLGGAFDKK